MPAPEATIEDLPTIEDSLSYVRGNWNSLFPTAEGRRKTIGNIPTRLHAELAEIAESRNLRMFEVIAGLVDFYNEYEANFESELATIRTNTKPRR
jgi:hypothetical protein